MIYLFLSETDDALAPPVEEDFVFRVEGVEAFGVAEVAAAMSDHFAVAAGKRRVRVVEGVTGVVPRTEHRHVGADCERVEGSRDARGALLDDGTSKERAAGDRLVGRHEPPVGMERA